jgi:hypothetical protein
MVGRVLRTDEPSGKRGALVLDHAGATLMHGLVTEPRAWSLDAARRRDGAPSVRQCPQCYAIAEGGTPACPECGEAYPAPTRAEATDLRVRAGELRELTEDQLAHRQQVKKMPRDWRKEFPGVRGTDAPLFEAVGLYIALKAFAAPRAYKPGWPAWMFNQVAGCDPSKAVREAAQAAMEVAG